MSPPSPVPHRARRHLALAGVVVALPLAALLGWSAFNRHQTGYFGPTTFQGYSLSNVTCPFSQEVDERYPDESRIPARGNAFREATTGDCANGVYLVAPELLRTTGLHTAGLSRRLTSLALRRVAEHPDRYGAAVAGQWVAQWNYWDWGVVDRRTAGLTSVGGVAHAVGRGVVVALNIACLATLAAWLLNRLWRRTSTAPLVVLVAGAMVVLTSTLNPLLERGALPRLLDPVHPAIILVVACGLTTIGEKRRLASQSSGVGGR